MNWKLLSFAFLIGLTITVVAYDIHLYSIPFRVYMSVGRWTSPFPSQYTTLSNVSWGERMEIEGYLKAGNIIHQQYIDVSDELSPIRSWAESMFTIYRGYRVSMYEYHNDIATFDVKLNEDEYYGVYLWQRKAYYPPSLEYNFNAILNVFMVATWIIFLHGISKMVTARQALNKL